MNYLEYKDWKSKKFWKIDLDNKSITVTYGKIGAKGRSTIKEYESNEKAKKEYVKQYIKKIEGNYFPVLPFFSERKEISPSEIVKLWFKQIQEYELFFFKAFDYENDEIEEYKTNFSFNPTVFTDFTLVEQGKIIPYDIKKIITEIGKGKISSSYGNSIFSFYDSKLMMETKTDIEKIYLTDWKKTLENANNIYNIEQFKEQIICLENSIPICFLPERGGEAYILLSYHKEEITISKLTHDEGIYELGKYDTFFNFIRILNEKFMAGFNING